MSRIHRALEKADREGLLTWTSHDRSAVATPEPVPAPVAVPSPQRPQARVAVVTEPPPAEHDGPAAEPEPFAHTGLSPMFVAATSPASSAAEHYRLLRGRIERQENGRRRQVLVVTSSCAGDGKTTTSANLALTMAQEFGQRVVLVEGDLRRPTLAAQFGLPHEPGLVDVLVGAVPLDAALAFLPDHGLHVLPGGLATERSGGLIASASLRRVIEALRGRFDRIIVDAPPSTIADAHELAQLADGLLVVVRAGVTPRSEIERTLETIDSRKLLGIVLNDSVAADHAGYSYSAAPRDGGRA